MKSRIILCITICLFQGLHAAISQTVDLGLARNYVVLANSGVSGEPQDGIRQTSDIQLSERAAAGLISSFRSNLMDMGNSINNLEWQRNAKLNDSAVDDMLDAYANALRLPPSIVDFNDGKIGGASLSPGVYKWNSDVLIDADIVFSGGQDDVWVFQIDGNLEQSDSVDMDLSGCGQENNVFWIVSGTSSIGQHANFEGNLLGDKDISLQNEAAVNGRVYSRGAVNLNDNIFRYADSGILEITKIADQQTYYYVGQVIKYTIVVYNAGVEPIYHVSVDDPRIDFHANIHILNPCNPYTYHVFYTITQSDIDDGSIVNTVCAESFDGDHDECATETIYAIKDARISITKSADKESFGVPGETITYQIVVNNPGNVTLKDVLISDDITNDVWYVSILSPGVTETFSTSYVTTQSDVDAGQVTNTASVIAVDPQGETVEDADQATVMVAQLAQLTIDKTTEALAYDHTGEEITYQINVSNTGNVTLRDVAVTDDLTGESWTIALLVPGESVLYNTTYIVLQADVDTGQLSNLATASGIGPGGEPVEDSDQVDLEAIQTPGLTLDKTTESTSYEQAGEEITYQIIVSNTGNVTLSDIAVTDNLTGESWTIATLAPGDSVLYNTSYIVRQVDVDAGLLSNLATASGIAPGGEPVEDSDQVELEVIETPELTLVKTTEALSYDHAGEEITYQITVSNTGNVTLSDIAVMDDLTGESWTIALLAPGENVLYSTTYIVLQSDMDAGQLSNLATASGISPSGEPVGDSDQVELEAIQNPGLTLVKTTEALSYDHAGEEIAYQIAVNNTGNVTLSDIAVTDDLTGERWTIATLSPGESVLYSTTYIILQADVDTGQLSNLAAASGSGPGGEPVEDSDQVDLEAIQTPGLTLVKTTDAVTYNLAGEEITYQITVRNTGNVTLSDVAVTDDLTDESWTIALLAPGESVLYSTTYVVLQSDIDAGQLSNLAAASGTAPGSEPVEDSDQVDLEAIQSPGLTLTKTTETVTYDHAGEEITYQITVRNTGNVTLTDISVTDDLTGESWTIAMLAPAESVLYNTTYVVLQADVDAGKLSNLATASGIAPGGEPVEDSDQVELEATQTPGLSLVKTTNAVTYNQAGEEITYQITVSNTGNVTLSNIAVADDLTGESWTIALLAPGESVLYNTTYVVLQSDVDAGQLSNLASASGFGPNDEPVEDSDQVELEAIQTPGILVVKTASPTSYENEGEIIQFTIEVSNSGNVTLTGISLTDYLTEETWAAATLVPGEKLQYTTSYTIKQQDIFLGSVTNRARAVAMAPSGVTVDDEDTATVHVIMKPAMQLTKTASQATFNAAGDVVTYAIDLQNTGNVILRNIIVNDNLTFETWTTDSLYPGEVAMYVATYVITQADMDFGSVENIATATATDPAGNTLQASDSERIFTAQISGVSIEKNATPPTYETVGARIDYTIDITNLGNVTLVNVQISDNLTGENWLIDVLLPGEKQTVNTSYTILQADLDHGSVVNVASVSGTDPHGQPVFDSDDEVVTAIINPSLAITKNASPSQYSDVGDVINFTFIVTNNGNVTITDVQVDDMILDARWNIPTLAPGESRTFNASYTIIQMDVDAGEFPNTVVVNGKDPLGNDVTADDSEIVTIIRQLPSLVITKTADPPVFISDGEEITYTIVVQNTGNVTLYNLTIVDDLTSQGWSLAELPRGSSQQYTTTYRITTADLSRGEVINIVTAFGYDPKGNRVDATAEETIITIRVPGGLTPDTDFDDTWFIRGLDYFPQNTVQIFNRWGTLVYEASPYLNDWDGVPNRGLIATDADGRVPAGTYYYVLVLKPGFKPMSGYIYLIKN